MLICIRVLLSMVKCEAIFVILPGKPQVHSGGEIPLLPSGSYSAKPGAQPRKSSQPDVCASQGKPLRTLAHQAEEEVEDDGLFIPMGRLSFSLLF